MQRQIATERNCQHPNTFGNFHSVYRANVACAEIRTGAQADRSPATEDLQASINYHTRITELMTGQNRVAWKPHCRHYVESSTLHLKNTHTACDD